MGRPSEREEQRSAASPIVSTNTQSRESSVVCVIALQIPEPPAEINMAGCTSGGGGKEQLSHSSKQWHPTFLIDCVIWGYNLIIIYHLSMSFSQQRPCVDSSLFYIRFILKLLRQVSLPCLQAVRQGGY